MRPATFAALAQSAVASFRVSRALLVREGRYLLPTVKLIDEAQTQITQIIDVTGRACIEAILEVSAIELAGDKTPGKQSGEVRWHGKQD
jgi:putative transposase